MEKYFTVEELANYLHYAEKTIYKWVINEEIPFFKINQSIRFRLSNYSASFDKILIQSLLLYKKRYNSTLFFSSLIL